VAQPAPEDALADWEVVDAFLSAARGGELSRLLELLAPDAVVTGDAAAVAMGTPERHRRSAGGRGLLRRCREGRLPAFVQGRPERRGCSAGQARVAFDFAVVDGLVTRIDFRAEPEVLAGVRGRTGDEPVDRGAPA
jgi:RNA polymerase sigma-70 factor (ECF subfamily)